MTREKTVLQTQDVLLLWSMMARGGQGCSAPALNPTNQKPHKIFNKIISFSSI